jgi:hypothetical protein
MFRLAIIDDEGKIIDELEFYGLEAKEQAENYLKENGLNISGYVVQ